MKSTIKAICLTSLLAGCVAQPVVPPVSVGVPYSRPIYYQPTYVRPTYVSPIYVRPTYAIPGPGYLWRYHPQYGWGWFHPRFGWHRGWH